MDMIAFISGQTFVYWSSVVLALSALTAVCVFLWLYLSGSGNWLGGFLLVPVAIGASLVLSRLIHWYCRWSSYEDLTHALSDLHSGGFALIGVFAGCLLAALVFRGVRLIRDLPQALDAMALAGAAGIALGRLSCLFNTADRGMPVEGLTQLPLVSASVNPINGQTEYMLATFMLQAIGTGLLFLALLVYYLVRRRQQRLRSGDTCLLFLLVYCCMQAILDSTRYDSLYLRSNGFVSLVQILCALTLLLIAVVFSRRMIRLLGWKPWFLALWLPMAASLGVAGYMEYYVQRHGDEAAFAYAVMGGGLACFGLLTMVVRLIGTPRILPQPPEE